MVTGTIVVLIASVTIAAGSFIALVIEVTGRWKARRQNVTE